MADELDWDKIVEDIGPRLFRYFCVRFSDELADDLTQETLLRLVRKVQEGKFDPERGSIRMLGFGIAHYAALEASGIAPLENLDDHSDILASDENLEQLTVDRDMAGRVRANFAVLSPVEQQILSLIVDEEIGLKEIGMILRIPESTVKSHVFRAKRKLTLKIQEELSL
jgi:RNA polymerase sigma-70 factor (ECF subfamily)